MTQDHFELIQGTGNVFRDFQRADAHVQQMKALLAARIIGVLDEASISTREAQARTGIHHAEFGRIRRAQLGCSTIDRLVTILNRLGQPGDKISL